MTDSADVPVPRPAGGGAGRRSAAEGPAAGALRARIVSFAEHLAD